MIVQVIYGAHNSAPYVEEKNIDHLVNKIRQHKVHTVTEAGAPNWLYILVPKLIKG